ALRAMSSGFVTRKKSTKSKSRTPTTVTRPYATRRTTYASITPPPARALPWSLSLSEVGEDSRHDHDDRNAHHGVGGPADRLIPRAPQLSALRRVNVQILRGRNRETGR